MVCIRQDLCITCEACHANDNFGRSTGDEVLIEAGKRLTLALSPQDMAARIGGDEFVVLIESLPREEDCIVQANRLCETIFTSWRNLLL